MRFHYGACNAVWLPPYGVSAWWARPRFTEPLGLQMVASRPASPAPGFAESTARKTRSRVSVLVHREVQSTQDRWGKGLILSLFTSFQNLNWSPSIFQNWPVFCKCYYKLRAFYVFDVFSSTAVIVRNWCPRGCLRGQWKLVGLAPQSFGHRSRSLWSLRMSSSPLNSYCHPVQLRGFSVLRSVTSFFHTENPGSRKRHVITRLLDLVIFISLSNNNHANTASSMGLRKQCKPLCWFCSCFPS